MKSCEKEKLTKLSYKLKTIAEANRLKVLCLLKEKELCVCEIVRALGLPHNLISHHLKTLEEIKMIKHHPSGKFHVYTINRPAVKALVNEFIKNIKPKGEKNERIH